jgi:glucosyl-3-phosphoglycerate synthase
LSSLSGTLLTTHHSHFPPEVLAAERDSTVSVCVPARNEARTIGPIVEALVRLREQGAVDQVVVVDASSDGTGEIAERLGAEVHAQADLMPSFGEVLGKGDAMWRALSVLDGDLVSFVDADTENFGPHFACGLIGPLVVDPSVQFVKAFYRRPFQHGGVVAPEGGGRVTELTARPLLQLFYPQLAGVHQPLAGEIGARRELLERLPFATGYAVEIAMLIDAWSLAGVRALAQVDLDVRQNHHQPLSELGPMAAAVLRAVAERLEREGRLAGGVLFEPGADPIVERPPMASLRTAA